MNLIYDELELEKFHKLLPPLEADEVYFLSLSARNKYLNEEERAFYDLGRSEMFARKLVKDSTFEKYLRAIRSYEIQSGWEGRGGKILPDKCLIVYANINTCSGKKALQEFYSKSNEILFNLANNPEAYEKLRYLDTDLLNCYQRATGTSKWIDVDFDAPDRDFLLRQVFEFLTELRINKVEFKVIETRSGYHVLLNRDTLKYNYTRIVSQLDAEAKFVYKDKAEVTRNSNSMVPAAGCLQGGFKVKFLDTN